MGAESQKSLPTNSCNKQLKIKKIDSQEHFVQEFETLVGKIDQNIANRGQYQRVENGNASNSLTEKLNRLKLHRTMLRNFLLTYKNTSEEEWIGAREKTQDVFKNAQEEF